MHKPEPETQRLNYIIKTEQQTIMIKLNIKHIDKP
jgi:hypothetical protein